MTVITTFFFSVRSSEKTSPSYCTEMDTRSLLVQGWTTLFIVPHTTPDFCNNKKQQMFDRERIAWNFNMHFNT